VVSDAHLFWIVHIAADLYSRSHMVNIIKLGDIKYLVDVGFGIDGPCCPVPLESKHEEPGISPQMLRLEYKSLLIHSDPGQRLWVYSHKRMPGNEWFEAYAFSELEFFPEDFEVMNYSTMTSRLSFFTQRVVAVKGILCPEKNEIQGVLSLDNNQIKKRIHWELVESEIFTTENERIGGLEKWFGIRLNAKEKIGIKYLVSELPE
jgi:arylamine N-acetyltransferase